MGSASSTSTSNKDHYSPFVKASNADRRKTLLAMARVKKNNDIKDNDIKDNDIKDNYIKDNEQPKEIISAVFVIHDKAKLLKYISWKKLWDNFLLSPATSFTIGIHIYLNFI